MQQGLALGGDLLVIPVHHHAFLGHIHLVIVDVLLDVDDLAVQLALEVGIFLLQQVIVPQGNDKQVPAVLDVGDARLDEQIEHIDKGDVDIAHAVLQPVVPKGPLCRHAMLELVPGSIGIGLLVVVPLEDHRQNGAQRVSIALVIPLSGQHAWLGEVVHHVSVLVGDGVKQPGRGGLGPVGDCLGLLLGLGLATDDIPVAQLPPALLLHNAVFQGAFGLLVLLQRGNGLGDLFLADGRLCLDNRCIHHRLLRGADPQLLHCQRDVVHKGLSPGVGGIPVRHLQPSFVINGTGWRICTPTNGFGDRHAAVTSSRCMSRASQVSGTRSLGSPRVRNSPALHASGRGSLYVSDINVGHILNTCDRTRTDRV